MTGSEARPPGPATEYPARPAVPLHTARLVLRPWRPDHPDDRDAYRRMFGDPDVVRYLYVGVLDHAAADAQLAGRHDSITGPGGWMNLGVELAATGAVVGDVGLTWLGDDHRQAEIGYVFDPVHQGNGYATEAASAMVDAAVDQLGAHRVCGKLDGRNEASAALLARLGMRHEATLVGNEWVKGEWTDEIVYAVLADDWRRRRTTR